MKSNFSHISFSHGKHTERVSNLNRIHRFFFFGVCFILLLCSADLVPSAFAASDMTASETCIGFIKQSEGFSRKPYYDYKQHTVGYGTKCPADKYFEYLANGIPKSEAEDLLRDAITDIESSINEKLIDRYSLSFSQHQFDALVSFTFNLGSSWMTYDSTLRNALLRNADENELIYAFGLYCTAGGNYSSGLVSRRLCEANMFLNGIYSTKVSDAHGFVFYDPNGGSLTYQVQGFICENTPAPMAEAVRSGDVFQGWYTDVSGGTKVTTLTKALASKTLFARWLSSESSGNPDSVAMVIQVTGDVVNIRKGPGTNYGISKQVYRNDTMLLSNVTYLSGRNWGKVPDGWICLDYTNYDTLIDREPSQEDNLPAPPPSQEDSSAAEPEPVAGTVRVNDLLRIRSGAGTAYATVGYLFNGNQVEILEQKTVGTMVWGRISRGWVSMNYIQTDPPDSLPNTDGPSGPETTKPTQAPDAVTITGRITADALRIRSGPDTANSIVGFYYRNDVITILEKRLVNSLFWGKTDKGWIRLDYVTTEPAREESSQPTDIGKKTVIADCLRVRKEIGTDSRIAALLYYGDTVTVSETVTVDGVLWGKVENGWISMEYVA